MISIKNRSIIVRASRRFSTGRAGLSPKIKIDKFDSPKKGSNLTSDKKLSKFVKEFNQVKVDLPRVPSTSHLDLRKFRQDILYLGYRPLVLPVKTGPVLRFNKNGVSDNNVNNVNYTTPNIWNNSAAGTQHFKEMDNIPYKVLMNLKPFQPPLETTTPVMEEEEDEKSIDWKDYFSKRGYN